LFNIPEAPLHQVRQQSEGDFEQLLEPREDVGKTNKNKKTSHSSHSKGVQIKQITPVLDQPSSHLSNKHGSGIINASQGSSLRGAGASGGLSSTTGKSSLKKGKNVPLQSTNNPGFKDRLVPTSVPINKKTSKDSNTPK